jgi:hypothetical protein
VKFWNSLYPAMSGQDAPVQALFWSAANVGDKGLVADLRTDPDVCRMEWAALPHEDLADPAVWRAAHPFWPSGRDRLIAKAIGRPGFAENWLNVWPTPRDTLRWLPVASTNRAAEARTPRLPPVSAVCGIECSLDGQRWALAMAWTDRRGLAVRVWLLEALEDALRIAGTRPVRAHRATVERAPMTERGALEAVTESQHRAATGELRRAVLEGGTRIAGIPDEQWAAVRTVPADGGEAIDARRSTGDVHAVKAAAWAVWAVQSGLGHSGLVL